MIADNDGTSGRGGGGGGYKGKCLFHDDCDKDKYDNDKETTTRRMGRGCIGERMMGGIPIITVTTLSVESSLAALGGGC